jgi:hypothetical protein
MSRVALLNRAEQQKCTGCFSTPSVEASTNGTAQVHQRRPRREKGSQCSWLMTTHMAQGNPIYVMGKKGRKAAV